MLCKSDYRRATSLSLILLSRHRGQMRSVSLNKFRIVGSQALNGKVIGGHELWMTISFSQNAFRRVGSKRGRTKIPGKHKFSYEIKGSRLSEAKAGISKRV